MLPLGCNISFMLLIDQEHFCWTQAVLHADSDLPSMDFNSRSSQCLGVHRDRREQNESRDYWLLYPRLHTALFFILVQYFDHSSVYVWINKLLLSRHLPMTSPQTQKRGKWTMKHLDAMCKLPLTLGPCVSACFCSSSPPCRTAESACTRTLHLSSNTCILPTTAIFPLHAKVSAKPNRAPKQGLNSVTWATHTAKTPRCPWT